MSEQAPEQRIVNNAKEHNQREESHYSARPLLLETNYFALKEDSARLAAKKWRIR